MTLFDVSKAVEYWYVLVGIAILIIGVILLFWYKKEKEKEEPDFSEFGDNDGRN